MHDGVIWQHLYSKRKKIRESQLVSIDTKITERLNNCIQASVVYAFCWILLFGRFWYLVLLPRFCFWLKG